MATPTKRPAILRGTMLPTIVCVCVLLSSCAAGSNGNSSGGPIVPVFVSTPGTAATQGMAYTYQIETMPAASVVTLALANVPSGATITGNTLTWTPTAAQSRVANQFSVTATNAAGSATQSWSVTPAGTVNGSWVDTYWTSSGPVSVPFDWTSPSPISKPVPTALVPQLDGSFKVLPGSGNSDGTFSIPNVPGGYYWLRPAAFFYWTSSSTFDFGIDVNIQAPSSSGVTAGTTTTQMTFAFSGLDPLQTGDAVAFVWQMYPPFSLTWPAESPAGTTTLTTSALVTSNINFSQSNPAFLLQYEPETVGTLSALKLGSEVALPNVSMTNGTSNTINGTLVQSPQSSFDLNVAGSAWPPLFSGVAPSPLTVEGADLEVTVDPFMPSGKLPALIRSNIPLLVDVSPSFPPEFGLLAELPAEVCGQPFPTVPGSSSILPGEPPITTDQDFGTARYLDPFPSSWPRVFTFCQTASVPIPLPNSTTNVSFQLVDAQSTSLPTAPVSPLIGQVRDPTIDGKTLYAATTISATGATMSWTAPSGATPTGYKIAAFAPTTLPNSATTYLPRGYFYTAKTSAVLPGLQAGQTYVFVISAILDGAANFETQPNRSALPTASVSVVSAPIAVTAGP